MTRNFEANGKLFYQNDETGMEATIVQAEDRRHAGWFRVILRDVEENENVEERFYSRLSAAVEFAEKATS